VSAVILLVSPIIDPSLLSDRLKWLDKSYGILDEMISRGNLIAGFRKSELQQLEDMLGRLPSRKVRSSLGDGNSFHQPINHHQNQQQPTGVKGPMRTELQTETIVDQDMYLDAATIPEVVTFPDALSTAQLIALADSIEAGDAEWISNAVIENSGW
jgi:proline utilization trans-activator